MPRFGRNPFPKKFGGGPSIYETEHLALLDLLAPGWDKGPNTANYAELLGLALAVTMIWQVNQRTANQAIPSKMLEALPDWEQILFLSPAKTDTAIARRAAVAAKLRGLAGNAIHDLQDTASTLAGLNYVGITAPDDAHSWAYWPGVNPGPPGLEWASNRASISVVLTQLGLSDGDFLNLIEQMTNTLKSMSPSWMPFVVGVDESGFICSVGTLGLTLLGGA